MRHPLARLGLDVMDRYNRARGGLLSAGLAFNALFATIPALLAIVGFLGLVIDDPVKRAQTVEWLVTQVPPLEPVAKTIVDTLADGARVSSIVGLVGVIWGASGFYGALEGAMGLMFPGSVGRDIVRQRLRGVIGVLALFGMVLAAVLVNGVIGFATSLLPADAVNVEPLLSPLMACGTAVAVCCVVYVLVPADGPTLRAAGLPAILAGLAIGLLTALFGFIGPFLVRGFAALGVIASVFVALIWLNLIFQALLYGASWASIRRDRARAISEPPRI